MGKGEYSKADVRGYLKRGKSLNPSWRIACDACLEIVDYGETVKTRRRRLCDACFKAYQAGERAVVLQQAKAMGLDLEEE